MSTRRAVGSVGHSRPVKILARIGYVGSALIHLLLGVLAIQVATTGGGEADQAGALARLGDLPGGPLLLWTTTVGLFALALWLAIQAILGIGSSSKKRWIRSLVAGAKAAAYVALGATALTFALGSSSNGSSSAQQTTATILSMPAGQLLLGVIGLAAAGVGVYMVAKGVRQKFLEDIDAPSGAARRPVVILGVVGYIAKGIAVVVVGILLVTAAISLDPSKSTGLDGALKALVALPLGPVILVAVGIGLIAFGVYTAARARLARL